MHLRHQCHDCGPQGGKLVKAHRAHVETDDARVRAFHDDNPSGANARARRHAGPMGSTTVCTVPRFSSMRGARAAPRARETGQVGRIGHVTSIRRHVRCAGPRNPAPDSTDGENDSATNRDLARRAMLGTVRAGPSVTWRGARATRSCRCRSRTSSEASPRASSRTPPPRRVRPVRRRVPHQRTHLAPEISDPSAQRTPAIELVADFERPAPHLRFEGIQRGKIEMVWVAEHSENRGRGLHRGAAGMADEARSMCRMPPRKPNYPRVVSRSDYSGVVVAISRRIGGCGAGCQQVPTNT